jgi:hypothetical protein
LKLRKDWQKVGKAFPKREYSHETHDEEIREKVWKETYDKVYEVAKTPSSKEERGENSKRFVKNSLLNMQIMKKN